ncbi:MAG: hypothetical protein HYV95_17585 [Opitutae bacterium]|nr:hypothetical protein [Opitutae bacterium]
MVKILSAVLFFVSILLPSVFAHPIHTSFAEADYNRATLRLEVALRVFANDFESALSQRAGKKVSLEKTPAAELDALIQVYLAERFIVRPADGAKVPLTWVGREVKDAQDVLWLYFEAPLPGGSEGARLQQQLLCDLFHDQLNTVRVRDGDRQVTLVFLPDQGEKTVRF